jgi:hypothetical protein
MTAARIVRVRRSVIQARVVADFIHALPGADGGGEMKNRIDAREGAANGLRITHVADDQLDIVCEIFGPSRRFAVHLRREVVERAHVISAAQQLVREMRSNESCAAGDQNPFAHLIAAGSCLPWRDLRASVAARGTT